MGMIGKIQGEIKDAKPSIKVIRYSIIPPNLYPYYNRFKTFVKLKMPLFLGGFI